MVFLVYAGILELFGRVVSMHGHCPSIQTQFGNHFLSLNSFDPSVIVDLVENKVLRAGSHYHFPLPRSRPQLLKHSLQTLHISCRLQI